MRSPVDAPVAAWLKQRRTEPLAVTVVTVMEIRHGIERTAQGKRRATMEADFEKLVTPPRGFEVLDFDERAARAAATFLAHRDSIGRPAEEPDMMIASIVASKGATLATRNVRDFVGLALPIENPYQDDA